MVDARQGGDLVDDILSKGFDLNQRMVLKFEDRYYHGADSINLLANMSTRSDIFNQVNAIIFRFDVATKILYPLLVLGRNLTLKLLKRKKIETPSI